MLLPYPAVAVECVADPPFGVSFVASPEEVVADLATLALPLHVRLILLLVLQVLMILLLLL
jgi:hypothetical protein